MDKTTESIGRILPGLAAAGVLAGAAFAVRSEYEKNHFVTEIMEIRSRKIRGRDKKFIFLTDLHEKRFGIDNAPLLRAIRREAPDGILIGGDMVVCRREDHGNPQCEASLSLIRRLSEEFPIWYSMGNHEDRMEADHPYFARLQDMGVKILRDESDLFGEDIRITGCMVEERFYRKKFTVPQVEAGYLDRHVGEPSDRFELMLIHSPFFLKEAARWGADLVLSGHFHGGTIRLPNFGGVMTPQYQFFNRYCAGEFEEDGTKMIVGRGLGTHSINIRIGDLPQLAVIRLRRG